MAQQRKGLGGAPNKEQNGSNKEQNWWKKDQNRAFWGVVFNENTSSEAKVRSELFRPPNLWLNCSYVLICEASINWQLSTLRNYPLSIRQPVLKSYTRTCELRWNYFPIAMTYIWSLNWCVAINNIVIIDHANFWIVHCIK